MKKHRFLKSLCLLLLLSHALFAKMEDIELSPRVYEKSDIQGIVILDAKILHFKKHAGREFSGISALAYSQKKGLYALSDNGYLFNLSLELKNKKIQNLTLNKGMALKTKKGNILKHNDAEGMAFSKKGLIISFERDPKVSLFSFDARKIKDFPLPSVLKKINNYQKKNKALESLVIHPDFGLITAPEAPLKHEDKKIHTLYSVDKRWKFKANGKITSMEVMPDKNLLILEREFSFLSGHSITLTKLDISSCDKGLCSSETLASLHSSKGWELDNFEGLTHIKDNIYLMISDDNENFLQKCIVVLFEVI